MMRSEIELPEDAEQIENLIRAVQEQPGYSEWTPTDDDDLVATLTALGLWPPQE